MIVISIDWKAAYAVLVEDTGSCCAFLLSSFLHRVRDKFPCVIVTDKHYDFVVSHRLLVLVL